MNLFKALRILPALLFVDRFNSIVFLAATMLSFVSLKRFLSLFLCVVDPLSPVQLVVALFLAPWLCCAHWSFVLS